MLLNELYDGRIVWNKVRMIKDPTTGKRVSRPNAKESRRVSEVPHLRIVDDATWQAAQSIKQQRARAGAARSRAPRRPLSGLLRCGSCGGGMSSTGATKGKMRVQCSTYIESDSCTNRRKVNREAIETTVFAGLRDELMQPATITEYVKTYNAERRRLAKGNGDRISKLTRRDAEIGRELERLINAVTKGVNLDTVVPRIKMLEAERAQVGAEMMQANSTADIVALHPAAIERYAADVARLADLTAAHHDLSESAELIMTMRRLVQEVIVYAEPKARGFTIEVKGRLSELTGSAAFPARSKGGGD
jgi:site-specific DNA recombinase